jgi:hypothetical protein
MKTIGMRDFHDDAAVCAAMEACGWTPAETVSGSASGVHTLGEHWRWSMGQKRGREGDFPGRPGRAAPAPVTGNATLSGARTAHHLRGKRG